MKSLLKIGMVLSFVAVMGLEAKAGAPAGGGLFVESAEGGATKLTISGSLRTRWEAYRNNMLDYESGNQDHQDWVDVRLRLGLGFDLADGTQVFIETQSNQLFGGLSGANAPGSMNTVGLDIDDSDDLTIYQANVTFTPDILGLEGSTLIVGRTELALGSEMLLGNNSRYSGLSHDGVVLDINPLTNLKTILFVTKLVENDALSLEDDESIYSTGASNQDARVFGVWGTYDLEAMDALVDAYVVMLSSQNDGTGAFGMAGNDEDVWTLGGRFLINEFEVPGLAGHKFDASAELALQFGDATPVAGGEEVDLEGVYATEVELGYRPPVMWSPRLAVGFDWSSGDEDGGDDETNSFVTLFQDTQDRLGKADLFAGSNLRSWHASLTANPMDKEEFSVGVAYYRFEAMEEADVVEGAAGNPDLPAASDENNIGDEIDLFAAYDLSDNVAVKGCWSHIDPQARVGDQVGSMPANRIHLTLVVNW